MATISLTRYRRFPDYIAGRWSDWDSADNQFSFELCDYNVQSSGFAGCHEFALGYANDRIITGLTLVNTITASYHNGTMKVSAYLYTSDPTTASSAAVPSGYIASKQVSFAAPSGVGTDYGTTSYTLSFSGLNLTVPKVYVFFKLTTPAGMYSVIQKTTVSSTNQKVSSTGMPTSISCSPSSVIAGNKVTVTIGNAYTSETVKFYHGSTLLGSATISSGTGQVTCPESWLTTAGVTAPASMTVTAKLSGTNLSSTFTLKAIPTDLVLGSTSATTGSKIGITITNAHASETVTFKAGNTTLGTATISNGSGQVTCPKSWFTTAGNTTSQSLTVTVSVNGTTLAKSFTLKAGSDAAPTIATPTVAIVQPSSASAYPSTYIAGISSAKVSAAVTSGTNATISAVKLSYGSTTKTMTYNSSTGKWEATVGPFTGNTTFTVTATDSRGLTKTAIKSITVLAYSPPTVTVISSGTYRCNSSGTKQEDGTYVRVQVTPTYQTDGLSGNTLTVFKYHIQEDTSKTTNFSVPASGTTTYKTLNTGRSADLVMTIVISYADKISGTLTKTYRIPPMVRNLAMRRSANGTYLGIGMLPQRTSGKSDIELPDDGAFLIGGYPVTGLTHLINTDSGTNFGKDFFNVDASSKYALKNTESYFDKAANDNTWSNVPPTMMGEQWVGIRRVIWVKSNRIMVQIYEMYPHAGRIWSAYRIPGTGAFTWRYTDSTAVS